MRISKPSRPRLVALAALGCGAAALAQDGAREQIGSAGNSALGRLEEALARGKANSGDQHQPVLPPPPTDLEKQRAWDGLRKRAPQRPMEARATSAHATAEKALAKEREDQAIRLRQALGLEPGEAQAIAGSKVGDTTKAWVPVLMVSSSMPIATLRNYAIQLERVHGVLAFRGMPGGLHKVGPMAKLSAQILRLDRGCEGPSCAMRNVQMIVDPILFRTHGVTRVPALAMVPGDPLQAYCERDEESPPATYLVFGDSALSGLLEEYARLGGKKEVSDAQAGFRLVETLRVFALWFANLPREAAQALRADRQRLGKALLIILPISCAAALAVPKVTLVMTPSIDAWAVRVAPGPIHKGDLVMFTLRHPIAGPRPVNVTKYVLCVPGDRLALLESPSQRAPSERDARFFCNGTPLGQTLPYSARGLKLQHFRWSGIIPQGRVYVGSTHPRGFDSRYFGLVDIARLVRMERLL